MAKGAVFASGLGDPSTVALHPDGEHLAVAISQRGVAIYRRDRTLVDTVWLEPEGLIVCSLHFVDGGRRCVSNGFLTCAWLWEFPSGELVHDIEWDALESSTHDALSPDGKRLVLCDEERNVRVFDVDTAEVVADYPALLTGMGVPAFHADGRRVAFGIDAGAAVVRVHDIATGAQLEHLAFPDGNGTLARFAGDRLVVIVGTPGGGALHLHDGGVTTKLADIPSPSQLVVTPDGRHALTSGSDPDTTVRVWDLERGTQIATLDGHARMVCAIACDGRRAATASLDGSVRTYDWQRVLAG